MVVFIYLSKISLENVFKCIKISVKQQPRKVALSVFIVKLQFNVFTQGKFFCGMDVPVDR